MDVRTLRAFVAVFEERNITAAATRLFITQPTLSTTIKTLEDELGVTLFVRQARGVEGTEAANRLYPRAKRLIADTDSLAREFRETSPCLELTVGIEADLGDGVVGTLVNGVLAHEEILLTLEEGCCGDVRLGCESLRCGDELFIPLLEEEFVLVLPPDHPLAGKGVLTPVERGGRALGHLPAPRLPPAADRHSRQSGAALSTAGGVAATGGYHGGRRGGDRLVAPFALSARLYSRRAGGLFLQAAGGALLRPRCVALGGGDCLAGAGARDAAPRLMSA